MILCGAWVLSGGTVERRLFEFRRRVALPRARRVEEVVAGPLWLACAPGCLAKNGADIAAWEGFVGPERPPKLAPGAGLVDGHYVAVCADTARGILSLLRDPTGGERLYFSVSRDLFFFAASLKTLLALDDALGGGLDAETALERGISELIQFGDRTLIAGVREVLPGHRLSLERGTIRQAWAWGTLLEPPEGDVATSARALRRNLKAAVERCIGREGKAAVALSGGVDSAAIAALAVELVGPENVSAFTVEYQDPGHPSEVPDAKAACRWLGIRNHQTVAISFEDCMAGIPEAVWLAEDPGYWKRAYPMMLAKAAAAAGFARLLTGFGVGSHMAYLEECARVLEWLPLPQWTLRYWSAARSPLPGKLGFLRHAHPGLEAPISKLYYPLLAILRSRGILKDLRPFFPSEIGPLVERMLLSPRVLEDLRSTGALPLATQLQRVAFAHMNSCVDTARCERVARGVGASWLGPAHFPSCLPLCYLSARPALPLWDARRRLRPGKLLLRQAMRGALPEATLQRRKYWPHANGSREWKDRALARMDAAAGPSWDALRPVFGSALEPIKRFAPEGLIPLAFWHRVLFGERGPRPPSWRELEADCADITAQSTSRGLGTSHLGSADRL